MERLTLWCLSTSFDKNRRLKPGAIPVLVVTALGFKNDLGNKCEGSKEIASILLLFYKMALLLHGDTQMLTLTFDKLQRIVFVAVRGTSVVLSKNNVSHLYLFDFRSSSRGSHWANLM